MIDVDAHVWEIVRGKPTILKYNHTLYYCDGDRVSHTYPVDRKPRYYSNVIDWIGDKKTFAIDDFKSEHPEIVDISIDRVVSFLIKEKYIQQLDDNKFKVLGREV